MPKLIPERTSLKQDIDIGWCGFPKIAPNTLCFFAGHISCYLPDDSYLVDEISIHGVSECPAFYITSKSKETKICGVIFSYQPNRVYGETLPGISIIRSVQPYQASLKSLKSLDEAKKEEKKTEKSNTSSPSIKKKKKSKKTWNRPIPKRSPSNKRSITNKD